MFFSTRQIIKSIGALEKIHPFLGITFFACKRENLPIGKSINFQLDSVTNKFLNDFHKISYDTKYFFQPFKSSDRKKKWVRPDYAAKGLQAINTQTFRDVFLHERNTSIWGWSEKYIEILSQKFSDKQKIPAFEMAVWVYKHECIERNITSKSLIERLICDFNITDDEMCLFVIDNNIKLEEKDFQDSLPTWCEYKKNGLPDAPDTAPERGGILSKLSISSVGPLGSLEIEPAKRLSLITGDNGLGKTFILDAAWWALTGIWADSPPYPTYETSDFIAPEIRFALTGSSGVSTTDHVAQFDFDSNIWNEPQSRQAITGLSLYARVDGSFAFWDPMKHKGKGMQRSISPKEIWGGDVHTIGGLIPDWNRWQSDPSGKEFKIFSQILEKLSPPDLGLLTPGNPVRIPEYSISVPTISHVYGDIPIVYASAGVRRVIVLAYLIVWIWSEHIAAASLKYEKPQRTMVILIDEMEAHLHPKWQRQFLPALLDIPNILSKASVDSQEDGLFTQFIIATHSPLVMASSEVVFDRTMDKIFHLELDNGLVLLDEDEYINRGDVSSWLESPIFQLKHARSVEAEIALEDAKSIQSVASPSKDEIQDITNRLKRHLANDDRFWPRWVGFAAKFGVDV